MRYGSLASFPRLCAVVLLALSTAFVPTTGRAQLVMKALGINAIKVSPVSVYPGSSSTGIVLLSAPAPLNGITVALTSSRKEVSVPTKVFIPFGASSAQFPISTVLTTSAPSFAAVISGAIALGEVPHTAELTVLPSPPAIESIAASVPQKWVVSGMSVNFSGLTPDREAHITSFRGSSGCVFAKEPDVVYPIAAIPAANGQTALNIAGKYVGPGTPTHDMDCIFSISYEWRPVGGQWISSTANKTLTLHGHEVVVIDDTARLTSWLRPYVGTGLGPCNSAVTNYNGKLAFDVTTTALGADCPYTLMTWRNHDRYTETGFNTLPQGVLLDQMRWTVETHGSGCCLGTSMNTSCAPLPTLPLQYSFDTMAVMDPSNVYGSRYAVFSNAEDIMTSDQIIIARNPRKYWLTAVMEIFGRLSCPAVNPLTTTTSTVSGALCDASCSALSSFGLAAMVPSGTGIGGIATINYVDNWQGQCRVNGGFLNGQCVADTVCPPLQEKFSDNGVWKCRTTTVTKTDMPSVRVVLDRVVILRPPWATLPF